MARASRIQIEERNQAILDFCEQQHPCTVRGVYYNLTTRSLVPKNRCGVSTSGKGMQETSFVR